MSSLPPHPNPSGSATAPPTVPIPNNPHSRPSSMRVCLENILEDLGYRSQWSTPMELEDIIKGEGKEEQSDDCSSPTFFGLASLAP